MPDTTGLTGYDEQMETIKETSGKLIKMLDYLEIIATMTLVKHTKEFSSQLKLFFISEFGEKDEMMAYSTLITDDCHQVLALKFPKDPFSDNSKQNDNHSIGM